MNYEIEIIRSKRKTLALEIKPNGKIIARAPLLISERKIYSFVEEKSSWIEKSLKKLEASKSELGQNLLTKAELEELSKQALDYIPKRVEYYSKIVGVNYGRITIRNQKTKWGSCSSKRNLNFNCLLMLAPKEVIDAIVVHELCHIKEMNHSKAFYNEVYKAYPEYDRWNKWLKQNGGAIMSRNPNR